MSKKSKLVSYNYTDGIGIRCKGCGYFTTGPGAIVKPFSSESGIDSTDYVCYYVDEDKKH
jgi:hypothetical protein